MAGQQKITGIFPGIGPLGKDCNNATNAACDIPMKDGCETRYYPDRCNYPVSATQMNAMISEIANVIKDAGIEYDCSKLDNLADAIQKIIENNLFGCLPKKFTATTNDNTCDIAYLVQTTDSDGCTSIQSFTPGSNVISSSDERSVWEIGTVKSIPETPDVKDSYYNLFNLMEDQAKGTIDETKLYKTKIARSTFSLNCPSTITLSSGRAAVVNPAANNGNGAVGNIVYRVDGVFFPSGDGGAARLADISNFMARYDGSKEISLNAGQHIIETFIVGATRNNAASCPQVYIGASETTVAGVDIIRIGNL